MSLLTKELEREDWYYYDDSKHYKINMETLNLQTDGSSNAYMLFYSKSWEKWYFL